MQLLSLLYRFDSLCVNVEEDAVVSPLGAPGHARTLAATHPVLIKHALNVLMGLVCLYVTNLRLYDPDHLDGWPQACICGNKPLFRPNTLR